MNKEDLIKRLNELITLKSRGSVSAFSRKIGLPQTSLNNYMLGRRKISLEVCVNILEAFDDISAEWLLRGEGTMLKSPAPTVDITKNKAVGDHNTVGDTTAAVTPEMLTKLLDQNTQLIQALTQQKK